MIFNEEEMKINRKYLHWLRTHQMNQNDLCQEMSKATKEQQTIFLNRLKSNVYLTRIYLCSPVDIIASQFTHGTKSREKTKKNINWSIDVW